MIKIFGSKGFMGSAIADECDRRGLQWRAGIRQSDAMKLTFELANCSLAINCAAYIPTPSVDLCRENKYDTLDGNVAFPATLALHCGGRGVPLIHLSTACLYDEKKEHAESDLPTRDLNGYCGVYLKSKLASELAVSILPKHYILRLRLPFDEFNHPKNYLSKLASFENVFTHTNSLTHRGDFAKWALDLWDKRSLWGTYHCCNEGQIPAEAVVKKMMINGIITEPLRLVDSPNTTGARLSVKKLTDAGIKVRHVEEAVDEAIKNWKP